MLPVEEGAAVFSKPLTTRKTMNWIYAFLGGAIVGAGVAILFAPEKGEDLRARIKELLRKKGIICSDSEIDALVEQLTTEIDD